MKKLLLSWMICLLLAGCVSATPLTATPKPTSLPPTPPLPTHFAPSNTPAPTVQSTPTAVQLTATQPSPTAVAFPSEGMKGWKIYSNSNYGFSFQYPSDWTLEVDKRQNTTSLNHLLWLRSPQYANVTLSIGFKRANENYGIARTGLGAGDLTAGGSVIFAGTAINRRVLVAQGKDMTVLYGEGEIKRGDLVFTFSLDYAGSPSDTPTLPIGAESQANLVVASFQISVTMQIANPASVNCSAKGGYLTLRTRADGSQYGVCLLGENRACEEWALMRGECPLTGVDLTQFNGEASQFCAISGGVFTAAANTSSDQGTCKLPGGKVCDALQFFQGQCTK